MLTEDHRFLNVCELTKLKFIDSRTKIPICIKAKALELCYYILIYGCDWRKDKTSWVISKVYGSFNLEVHSHV